MRSVSYTHLIDDSLKAISYGIDAVIVSNHGGRNMDSAAATLRLLPEIAEAVGDKMTVILDSGVRRGSDIVKALALGAKAVLTGRATLYGTAVDVYKRQHLLRRAQPSARGGTASGGGAEVHHQNGTLA